MGHGEVGWMMETGGQDSPVHGVLTVLSTAVSDFNPVLISNIVENLGRG